MSMASESEGITPSSSPSSAETSGFERAYNLFEGGEFLVAAESFDRLFADFGNQVFRHYAALSWAAAGDDTRAILRWRQLLADPRLVPKLAKEVRRYLEGAYQRTVALSIQVTPESAVLETSKITLEPQAGADGPEWRPFSVPYGELKGLSEPDAAGFKLHVRPGSWRIGVLDVHPGYQSLHANIKAQAQAQHKLNDLTVVLVLQPRVGELQLSRSTPAERSQPLLLVLEDSQGIEMPRQQQIGDEELTLELRVGTWRYEFRDPKRGVVARGSVEIEEGATEMLTLGLGDPGQQGPSDNQRTAEHRLRRRLGLGLGAGGLGLLAGGLAWIPYRQADSVAEFFAEGSTATPAAITASHERLVEGLIFVGSGVGVEVGALSVLLGIDDRGLAIEAGVGGAAFAGGLALVLSGGVCLNQTPYTTDGRLANEASIRTCRRRDFAGGAMVGSGAGLLTSSAIALLTRALVRRRPNRRQGKPLKVRAKVAGGLGRGFSIGVRGSF